MVNRSISTTIDNKKRNSKESYDDNTTINVADRSLVDWEDERINVADQSLVDWENERINVVDRSLVDWENERINVVDRSLVEPENERINVADQSLVDFECNRSRNRLISTSEEVFDSGFDEEENYCDQVSDKSAESELCFSFRRMSQGNHDVFVEDIHDPALAEMRISREELSKLIQYAHIGKNVLQGISLMKPKERRHILALVSPYMTHNSFKKLFDGNITKDEWTKANRHANFPGAGYPESEIEKCYRKRVKEDTIEEFIHWLYATDKIQHVAYGEKVLKLSSGKFICAPAINRTIHTTGIVKEYFRAFIEGRNDNITEFCDKVSPKTGTTCLKPLNHGNRCNFTPKDGGMLSPSMVEKIVNELTSGEIRSLVGLDNIYVECGRDNFEHMKAWVDIMSNYNRVAGMIISLDEFNTLCCRIENAQEFHQIGFAQHLGKVDSKFSCVCYECGFYHANDETFTCQMYINNMHIGPCGDCYESFKVLDDMYMLHNRLADNFKDRGYYQENPVMEDDMNILYEDLGEYIRKLLKYREHVAQKEDEALFDSEFFANLKEDEVVVVMDYKMKILSSFFRETQLQWFAKRGFSCLGVLLFFGSSSGNTNRVEYHVFLSSDTTQDCDAVNIVKDIIYNVVLAEYNISKVHFRADGAKNFVGNQVKSIIAQWGIEKSFKTTVPGCGKTSLDGLFGIISQFLARANNAGKSFKTAEELWEILDSADIDYCYFHLFEPSRDQMNHFQYEKKVEKKVKSLGVNNYYYLTYKDGEVRGYYHSRHGEGKHLALLDSSDENSQLAERKERGRELLRKHVKKSYLLHSLEKLPENKKSVYEQKKWRARKAEDTHQLVEKKNEKMVSRQKEKIQKQQQAGLYPCDQIHHKTGQYCTRMYNSAYMLSKHKADGKHIFPSVSLLTNILDGATSGKYALCLDKESIRNRDCTVAAQYAVKDGPGKEFQYTCIDKNICFGRGCYHKINPATKKPQFNASKVLQEELFRMFMEGQDPASRKLKSSKFTPEEALAELKNRVDEHGRRFYGPNCKGGKLPTLAYIKQRFSALAKEKQYEFSYDLLRYLEDLFVTDSMAFEKPQKLLEKLKDMMTEEGEICLTQLPKRKDLKLWFEQRKQRDMDENGEEQ